MMRRSDARALRRLRARVRALERRLEEPDEVFLGPPLNAENLHAAYLHERQRGARRVILAVDAGMVDRAEELVEDAGLRALAGVMVDESFIAGAWELRATEIHTYIRGDGQVFANAPADDAPTAPIIGGRRTV